MVQEAILWLHLDKVPQEVRAQLEAGGVELRELESSLEEVAAWVSRHPEAARLLLSAPSTYLSGATYALYSAVPDTIAVLGDSPILDMKAVKNSVEEAGMVEAHIR